MPLQRQSALGNGDEVLRLELANPHASDDRVPCGEGFLVLADSPSPYFASLWKWLQEFMVIPQLPTVEDEKNVAIIEFLRWLMSLHDVLQHSLVFGGLQRWYPQCWSVRGLPGKLDVEEDANVLRLRRVSSVRRSFDFACRCAKHSSNEGRGGCVWHRS